MPTAHHGVHRWRRRPVALSAAGFGTRSPPYFAPEAQRRSHTEHVNARLLYTKSLATAVAISTTALALAPALPATAAIGPKAPGMLKVERTGAGLTTLSISWRAVEAVDHYTVTVFDGQKDVSTVVGALSTNLTVAAPGACTRYQVRVAAVDAEGNTATTGPYRVAPLAPGSVTNLDVDRSKDGTDGVAFWSAPRNPGAAAPSYTVQLKQLNTGKIISEDKTGNTKVSFGGLDPKRAYAVKVTARNDYGQCVTSTSLLRNEKPAEPTGLFVVRESAASAIVMLRWKAPRWRGYGNVDAFEVAYRASGEKAQFDKVPADQDHAKLELDPNRNWTFQVRAVGDERGGWSKPAVLNRDLAPGKPELDPAVTIAETNGTVTVDFAGPVGSSSKYPTMLLSIKPTVASKGFRDTHTVSNTAGRAEFTQVPCGVYTVTVTGMSPDRESKEFGRQVINRCDTGAIPANMWKLVFGRADITGNYVDMRYGNESRVMSTTKRSSKDAVFTTEATLRSGWGYGIWTQASLSGGSSVSGYSFQYDPGYANVNPGFGKALLLRVWDSGRECGNPVAKVKWPDGLQVGATHRVVVVNEADTLYASIDGIKMFDVPSLKAAMKSSGCAANFADPSGTEVGFRSWNASSSVFFENTTLS